MEAQISRLVNKTWDVLQSLPPDKRYSTFVAHGGTSSIRPADSAILSVG